MICRGSAGHLSPSCPFDSVKGTAGTNTSFDAGPSCCLMLQLLASSTCRAVSRASAPPMTSKGSFATTNRRLSLQSGVPPLPRECRSRSEGDDGARNRRRCAARPRSTPDRHARHHRRCAGIEARTSVISCTAHERAVQVIDRCNLTILKRPGREDLADFLAAKQSRSWRRCRATSQDNVEKQRGDHVFEGSIRGLQKPERAGLRHDATGSRSTSCTIRTAPTCRRRRKAWKPTTSAILGEQLRRRVQPALYARQHADPALRSRPASQGGVRCLPAVAQASTLDDNLDGVDVPQLMSVD